MRCTIRVVPCPLAHPQVGCLLHRLRCALYPLPQVQNKITLLASTVMVPAAAPRIRDWYAEREAVVSMICDRLELRFRDGENTSGHQPLVVGVAGPSGAGKTIAASMVVAREDVRAHFRKGVLWLKVGQEAQHRLPALMDRLANMVFDVMTEGDARRPRAPDVGVDPENGAAYIRKVVGGDSRFLVVADDVWEAEVIEELKSTGATVLYTTRSEHLCDDSTIRLHELLNGEVAAALMRAAELDNDMKPPDASAEIVLKCGPMAMDLAFVGRWGTVRGTTDAQAWASALSRIVKTQEEGEGEEGCREAVVRVGLEQGEGKAPMSWRAAVLRAGLDELVLSHNEHRQLYLSLAVIPKNLAFTLERLESLVYDEGSPAQTVEAARGMVATFDEWSILTLEEGGKYHVHDAHLEYARALMGKYTATRDRVLARWRKRLVTADSLFAWPLEELVEIWQTIAGLEGETVDFARLYDGVLDSIDPSDSEYANHLRRIAFFLWLAGDRDAACDKWAKFLTVEQHHRMDTTVPNLDITLVNVGVHLWGTRRTAEAERCFRRALSIQEKHLGADHLDVAGTLHRLAWCLFTAGRIDDADPLHRRALSIQKEKLGPKHPDVARTLHALGLCMSSVQRGHGAEWFHHRALEIYEKQLGADHPKVALALYELGRCTSAAGKAEEAERFYRQALSIQEKYFDVDSLPVAETLYALAGCLSVTGALHEVTDMYRRVLAIREDKPGGLDPMIARAAFALGQLLLEAGRTEEATPLLRRALATTKEIVGWDHPAVADTLHSLGTCALCEGRLEQADELYRQCLATREAKLNASHPSVAHTLYDLGRCASLMGKTGEAEGLYRRALLIQEDNLGADHLEVATILYVLGSCAAKEGRVEEAEGLYRRALKSREGALGADHVDVADTLRGLGRCAYETERWKEAGRYYSKALAIYEEALGPDHAQVAYVLRSLGKAFLEAGRIEKAEAMFTRELAIVEKQNGARHPSTAHAFDYLGQCAFELGRMADAEEMYRLVLAIWEERLGTDHLKVAAALHSLGLCVFKSGRKADAMLLYSRALSIGKKILGADHPDLASTLHGLKMCGEKDTCSVIPKASVVVRPAVAKSSAAPGLVQGADLRDKSQRDVKMQE